MIIIHSDASEASASGKIWHSSCTACRWVQDGSSRPTHAIAGALEHQRRCKVVKYAPVEWVQDGLSLGIVTPHLGIDLAEKPDDWRLS